MADIVKSLSSVLANLPVNTSKSITAQHIRDSVVSNWGTLSVGDDPGGLASKSKNALWWGLDNTGATDTTAEMEQLIEDFTDGDIIFFPPGTYDFSSSWTNYKLLTHQVEGLYFWAIPDTVTFIGRGNYHDFQYNNFIRCGPFTKTVNYRIIGINFNTWGRIFQIFGDGGVDIGDVVIENCRFINSQCALLGYTADINTTVSANSVRIVNNELGDTVIDHPLGATNTKPIHLINWGSAFDRMLIEGNWCHDLYCNKALQLIVVGNFVHNPNYSWWPSRIFYRNLTVTNNHIDTCIAVSGVATSYGIITQAQDVIITNNQIRNVSNYGMYLEGDRTVVDGNVVVDWGQSTSGVEWFDGVSFHDNAEAWIAIMHKGGDRSTELTYPSGFSTNMHGPDHIITNNIFRLENPFGGFGWAQREKHAIKSVRGEYIIDGNFADRCGGFFMGETNAWDQHISNNYCKNLSGLDGILIVGDPARYQSNAAATYPTINPGRWIIKDNAFVDHGTPNNSVNAFHFMIRLACATGNSWEDIVIDGNLMHYNPSGMIDVGAGYPGGRKDIRKTIAFQFPAVLAGEKLPLAESVPYKNVHITNNIIVNAGEGIGSPIYLKKFSDGLHSVSGFYIQNNRFIDTTTPIHSQLKAGMDNSAISGSTFTDCIWRNNEGYDAVGVAITGGNTIDINSEDEYYTVTNTTSQTITNFSGRQHSGRKIRLSFDDGNTTIQHNSNIKLKSSIDFNPSATSTLSLQRMSSTWNEIGRMSG